MRLEAIKELYLLTPEYIQLSPSSKRIYNQGFGYISEIMKKDADKISRPFILDFRDKTYKTPARCRIGLMVLSLLLQFGYDRGYCSANPARGIGHLPPKTGFAMWTMEDVEKVLKVADQTIKDVITLALYTGQRRSDLVKMHWDDYDGTFIHVIQKKTKKALSVPVHPILKKELDRLASMRGDCGYILTSPTGWQWSVDNLTRVVSRVAKEAGVSKPLHGLRKTTATVLAESGCTPFEIAAITGQSLKEVINYTRAFDQKALAMKAIERWNGSK
jgi:integrase